MVPQANEILQNFLQSQAAVEESIMHLDKALTAGDMAKAGTGEGSTHSGMGRFLQCPLTDLTKDLLATRSFLFYHRKHALFNQF